MRTFEGLTKHDITDMCFDVRRRKLIVTDQSGMVQVRCCLSRLASWQGIPFGAPGVQLP